VLKKKAAQELFRKLADIENLHKDRLYREYEKVTDEPLPREEFISSLVTKASEGGLTTREYSEMFQYDLESLPDIIGMAMSIEAQALDLYQRASEKSRNESSKKVLAQLADEARAHLQKLGKFMESL
jgi:rubrerythrin